MSQQNLVASLFLSTFLSVFASSYNGPKVILGTGGGGGGFNAPDWIANGGNGFNMALAYCYTQFTPQCSQVTVANAVSAANLKNPFYVTKIEPEDMGPTSSIWGFVRPVTRDVLSELNINKIDVLAWHQAGRDESASNYRPPCFNASAAGPAGPGSYAACRIQGYQALLDIQKAGGATTIGVSNYDQNQLQQLYDALSIWPEILEIEIHPYYLNTDLVTFAMQRNITLLAYAPLAIGNRYGLLSEPVVLAAATAHNCTPAQVIIKWHMQYHNGVVLPRSTNSSHMTENLAAISLPFTLTADEMTSLSSLPQKPKLYGTSCTPFC
jgi:diketogulonate reductase-like aldo/keto reductase